jgi:hypothetical protein
VLAVVDHQQQVAIGEVAAQRLHRSSRAAAADVERSGDLGGGVGARRKVDQPDPVPPSPDLTAGNLNRQPRLPDPGGTGQRHEPGPAEHFADPIEFARAADQRRQRHGNVVLCKLGSSRGGRRCHATDDHTTEVRELAAACGAGAKPANASPALTPRPGTSTGAGGRRDGDFTCLAGDAHLVPTAAASPALRGRQGGAALAFPQRGRASAAADPVPASGEPEEHGNRGGVRLLASVVAVVGAGAASAIGGRPERAPARCQ